VTAWQLSIAFVGTNNLAHIVRATTTELMTAWQILASLFSAFEAFAVVTASSVARVFTGKKLFTGGVAQYLRWIHETLYLFLMFTR